jgi:O-6-methylguanine DNA methyltransferase
VPTFAIIPTAWGVCGIVWKCPQSDAPLKEGHPFAEKPANAMLCRIMTPGLPLPELRAYLLALHRNAHEALCDDHGYFHPEVVPEWLPNLVSYLQRYYTNALRDWSAPRFNENWTYWKPRLDWPQLTDFQRKVLEITAEIPRGMHLTYGDIARRIGKPAAARAVGAALGSNPWPVLVPCHRVLGTGGSMTGFSAPGGINTKKRMLDLEKTGLFA